MPLNKEYFDAINIDVVKKKYYNANKVNAVFEDIRVQAEALQQENSALKAELEALRLAQSCDSRSKDEIAEIILSTRIIAQKLLEEAKDEAAKIISDAEAERDELRHQLLKKQDYALRRVERCFNNMRQHQLDCISALNGEWQDFLCGLDEPDGNSAKAVASEDLSKTLGAIADLVREIDE